MEKNGVNWGTFIQNVYFFRNFCVTFFQFFSLFHTILILFFFQISKCNEFSIEGIRVHSLLRNGIFFVFFFQNFSKFPEYFQVRDLVTIWQQIGEKKKRKEEEDGRQPPLNFRGGNIFSQILLTLWQEQRHLIQ